MPFKYGNLTVGSFELADGSVTTAKLADNAVNTNKIVNDAITAAKLAANAVDEDSIAAGAVSLDKVADNAIDADSIVDAAIEEAKLATGAVTETKIGNLAVTNAKIAALAVDAAKIAVAAITTAKIDALAVTAAKIGDLAVTNAKIDALAVTEGKIAALAVTSAKIAAAAIQTAHIEDLAVTDAKILELTVDKLLAGSLQVAEYIQSFGFVENPEDPTPGFRINGMGDATFNSVTIGSPQYQVDEEGNASFSTLAVGAEDLNLGGFDLVADLLERNAKGLIAFASQAADRTFTTTETAILELSAPLERDRMYRVMIPTLAFQASGSVTESNPARYSIRLRENGKLSPTTSSNLLTRASPPNLVNTGARQYTTDMEYVFACVDHGLELDGNGSANTPDSALFSVTDLDIAVEFDVDDWSGMPNPYLLASRYHPTGNNRSWMLALNEDHTIRLGWTTDGVNLNFIDSTESINEGDFIAVRVTLDVNNGAGGKTATFYVKSTMQEDEETGEQPEWEEFDQVTEAGTTSIFDGTAGLSLGETFAGGTASSATCLVGMIRRFEMRDSIDGTLIADPTFTAEGDWIAGDDAADNNTDDAGRTWTLQDTAEVAFEYGSNAATLSPGDTRFLLTADITITGGGNNSATIDTANGATNPIQILVEDIGPFNPNTGVVHASTGGGGTTEKKKYTKTYNAQWSRAYRGNDTVHETNGEIAQGDGGFGNGDMKSWVGFNFNTIQSDLSGATILKCEFYLYYDHWYFNAGGTAIIGTHESTSGSAPSFNSGLANSNRKQVENWSRNEGKWVNMGTGVGNDFKSGDATGIMIGPDPGANQLVHYGKARGNSENNEPRIRITYEK